MLGRISRTTSVSAPAPGRLIAARPQRASSAPPCGRLLSNSALARSSVGVVVRPMGSASDGGAGGQSTAQVGVAVNTREGARLHCGDVYFHYDESRRRLSARPARAWSRIRPTRRQGAQQLGRLRELAREHRDQVRLICRTIPSPLTVDAHLRTRSCSHPTRVVIARGSVGGVSNRPWPASSNITTLKSLCPARLSRLIVSALRSAGTERSCPP